MFKSQPVHLDSLLCYQHISKRRDPQSASPRRKIHTPEVTLFRNCDPDGLDYEFLEFRSVALACELATEAFPCFGIYSRRVSRASVVLEESTQAFSTNVALEGQLRSLPGVTFFVSLLHDKIIRCKKRRNLEGEDHEHQ